jgi:hypothetical protein
MGRLPVSTAIAVLALVRRAPPAPAPPRPSGMLPGCISPSTP